MTNQRSKRRERVGIRDYSASCLFYHLDSVGDHALSMGVVVTVRQTDYKSKEKRFHAETPLPINAKTAREDGLAFSGVCGYASTERGAVENCGRNLLRTHERLSTYRGRNPQMRIERDYLGLLFSE